MDSAKVAAAQQGHVLAPDELLDEFWRQGITAGALMPGSVALLILPLSRKSTEAMSGI